MTSVDKNLPELGWSSSLCGDREGENSNEIQIIAADQYPDPVSSDQYLACAVAFFPTRK